MSHYFGIIEHYRDYLPIATDISAISLCEGNTPLIPLRNIPQQLGGNLEIYVKYEGLNPTASFKDRGMTVAVTQAYAEGSRAVVCASTGNTSAAAAAYAARAGMQAFVLIPAGKIAQGKLAQARLHGAVVLQIQGNFDEGMQIVKQLADDTPITIVNSINPLRLQGQKTAAFEIIDTLGRAPDFHCLPVGNAGNISAYWTGYTEYFQQRKSTSRPKMLGYQASGAAPFLQGHPITAPETVATAIRIGNPQSWNLAVQAQIQSDGWFAKVTDEEILAAQKLLAVEEGIFCEPASAASIAGLINDIQANKIPNGSTIACTLTGHGLKDPDIATQQSQAPIISVEPEFAAVREAILQRL